MWKGGKGKKDRYMGWYIVGCMDWWVAGRMERQVGKNMWEGERRKEEKERWVAGRKERK